MSADGTNSCASLFSRMGIAAPLEQFMKNQICNEIKGDRKKANLTVGAYRDDQGQPWVLPVVREAEQRLLSLGSPDSYEPTGPFGFEPFTAAALELLLGKGSVALREGRVLGVHVLSGTGALRLGAEFLLNVMGIDTVCLSDPTWNEHWNIFRKANFRHCEYYRYYDEENRRLDFEAVLQDLERVKERSVVLLQACAHNPTGLDLSRAQWAQIASLVKRRHLLPFFDIAYHGLASGDPDEDAWPVRHFVEQDIEMLVTQSFAKNFGLYNERIGVLTFVVRSPALLAPIKSRLVPLIQSLWSEPPTWGARIVHLVLTSADLRRKWLHTVREMASRIAERRVALQRELRRIGAPGDWSHITLQRGFFSFTGLTAAQVDFVGTDFNVFMLSNGRANMCGLNAGNVAHVAEAFRQALRNKAK